MTMACLVLASGLSRRFGDGDKLMQNLGGKPLLAHCLIAASEIFAPEHRFIVVPNPDPRSELASQFEFSLIDNPEPETGQGRSLAIGVQALLAQNYHSVCVLLADMPFISPEFIQGFIDQSENFDIGFSQVRGRAQPPAIFKATAFEPLTGLSGDQGARALDLSAFSIAQIPLPEEMARDIDIPDDIPDDFAR
ncbi:MAG: nucleotidyltransferase family protein [Hellea sp.]|nr:nucleotidyltransferase family protein [Hellea sp.]